MSLVICSSLSGCKHHSWTTQSGVTVVHTFWDLAAGCLRHHPGCTLHTFIPVSVIIISSVTCKTHMQRLNMTFRGIQPCIPRSCAMLQTRLTMLLLMHRTLDFALLATSAWLLLLSFRSPQQAQRHLHMADNVASASLAQPRAVA